MKFARIFEGLAVILWLSFTTIALPAVADDDVTPTMEPGSKTETEASTKKWDVNNPPGEKRAISINVDSGTWMSLDVSPDGQMIAFDLLGDIYTIPATGGTATNISSGMAWEYQPRFSPDGSRIAFTSDRAGGDNIWTMNVDGSGAEQVTDETFRLTNNPTWSPDGRFIAARKHFTTSRSLGTGEIWLYHTSGGSGVKLVKRPSESHQKELGEPMFSPDGNIIYYSQNTTPGSRFIYAQDSNTELFQIKAYDINTGEITTTVGGAGGAVRPTPSPDGKMIAFVKRERAKSKLYVRDLRSGEERKIYDDLDQDMQETWAVQGVYPNMDWSPNSQYLYFWARGKIRRIDVLSSQSEIIPFQVTDTRDILSVPRPKIPVSPDSFKTTMPRYAQVSPNGQQIVFESLGKLFIQSTRGGSPKRLTGLADTIRELDPSWSRDSRRIVFTTWTDTDLGAVRTIGLGFGGAKKITEDPGIFRRPAFSPDANYIVYEKQAGGYLSTPEWSDNPGLYVMNSKGEDSRLIRRSGSLPHFGAENSRIFFSDSADKKRSLMSVDMNGEDARTHMSSTLAQSFMMAPDGRNVAFRENYNLYLTPALPGPQDISVSPKGKALPVKKVSVNGATWPAWSGDGETLTWSLGPNMYRAEISKVMEEDTKAAETFMSLSRDIRAFKPTGRVALTNARIVTMTDGSGGVIENGSVIINGDRITDIIDGGVIPDGIRTFDMEGKTIIPGLVDAHAHGPQGIGDMTPNQNWSMIGHLALGVTTIFDPSTRAASFFPASEMQRAGKILSPRLYATGEVIYGAKSPGFFADIGNFDDAREHVTRLKDQGAHGVKNYNQPRRDQRQQVTQAAREYDMLVVPEGGSLYHMDMSLVADGNSSVEHNIPVSHFYDDVIQMYGQSGVAYVPTLVVTYGGIRGEDFYYQESNVWEHPILTNHVPPTILQARAVRRQMAPEEDYADDEAAAAAKLLEDAGVLVTIGAHGQREGLAAHWEIWSFARGGMSPVQALRTATVNPAKHLGFFDDLGSLSSGKLADMVILNANPLDDIWATDDIAYVMQGGRMFDPVTMDEVFTGDTMRAPYWWED